MLNQVLITSLFVTSGLGFVVGYMTRGEVYVSVPTTPSNYDPVRPIVEGVLKAERDRTEDCNKALIAHLQTLHRDKAAH